MVRPRPPPGHRVPSPTDAGCGIRRPVGVTV